MVRSLQPRAAARERGSSLVMTSVAKTLLLRERAALAGFNPNGAGDAGRRPLARVTVYWWRPYFLNVAFQSAASESSALLALPSPAVT